MYLTEHILKVWANEALQKRPYYNKLFPPSPYYRFFEILAKEIKPNLSVVLGVCGGGDCLHLALGNPEGKVVGIDYQYDHEEQIKYIINKCSNFTFWQGDSVEDAGKVFSDFGKVQFLFVDTSHTKEQTLKEFEAWHPYLDNNYVVCFDDLLREEMGNVWELLPSPKLRLDELHPTAEGGFGIIWSIG